MELVGLQTNIAWEDRQMNFAKVRALLASARIGAGSMIALPEMFGSGFSLDVQKTADPGGETERFLTDLARRHDCCVVGGLNAGSSDGRATNEALAVGPDGKVLSRYQKIFPFSPIGEGDVYQAGGHVSVFDWGGFTVATFICYDLRFPEVFRDAASLGADMFVVIANWPTSRISHWTALLRARAIENQAFVMGVNRVGSDPHLNYPGKSAIISPTGDVLAEANSSEGLVRVSVDLRMVVDWRAAFPALKDRRPPGTSFIAPHASRRPAEGADEAREHAATPLGFGEALANKRNPSPSAL